MKLRNKKTGEIVDIADLDFTSDNFAIWLSTTKYSSLAELNEEWEDYEEPKEFWYIAHNGIVGCFEYDDDWQYMDFNWQDKLKQIGNYFETKEEAEKAVEKLKAWKRLKDKGYRVMMNNHVDGMLYLRIWNDTTDAPTPINKAGEIYKDLELLFGGEK